MLKKDLEFLLNKIPDYVDYPEEKLEQYATPSHIAADMLWQAFMMGDILGKIVVDFGSGTGRLAVGATALGAKYVVAVDIDIRHVIKLSKLIKNKSIVKLLKSIDFVQADINHIHLRCDTVIQNPPFGVYRKGADTEFLIRAFKTGKVIYSLHKSHEQNRNYLTNLALKHGFKAFILKTYNFPIKASLRKHRKRIHYVLVDLIKYIKT